MVYFILRNSYFNTYVNALTCIRVSQPNKHKFVQKDAKGEVLDIIMSLIEQSCAELGEQGWANRVGQAE